MAQDPGALVWRAIVRRAHSLAMGIAIYPGTRNPGYHRDLGLPLEDKLIAALDAAGGNHRSAPVLVQRCEPGSLKEMRAKGLWSRMVQLIDGSDIDLKTGKITHAPRFDRPYDRVRAGDPRLFAAKATRAGVAEIKTCADGIGPWKPHIVPVKGRLDAAGRLVRGALCCSDRPYADLTALRSRPAGSPQATAHG